MKQFDHDILSLWLRRMDTKQIAIRRGVSEFTVYNRLAQIREAANVRRKAHDDVRVRI